MSQPMGQQASRQAEAVTGPWRFYIDLATTAAYPGTAKNITGGATITLNRSASGVYTGTMQFNYPVIEPGPGIQPGQVSWSQRTFALSDVSYEAPLLSFNVSAAVPAFQDNFNAETGALLASGTNGPQIPASYQFIFSGNWDGTSNTITNGQAFVPDGWLEDCPAATAGAPPSESSDSPDDSDRGGDDPANASWTSGGG